MSINDKFKQVLTIKQLSPSQLADAIGVQRSSISHILSGRNRPSLDIIQKLVRCYSEFTYDWFLEDDDLHPLSEERPRASPRPAQSVQLSEPIDRKRSVNPSQTVSAQSTEDYNRTNVPEITYRNPAGPAPQQDKQVDRILIFYTDGTFREYRPS